MNATIAPRTDRAPVIPDLSYTADAPAVSTVEAVALGEVVGEAVAVTTED